MLSISRYNRLNQTTQRTIVLSAAALAFVLYFGLQSVGYPLAGVGAFVVLLGGAVGLSVGSTARLFDERDHRVHERAAGHTIALYGWMCAIGFPTVVALDAIGHVTFPDWLVPISVAVIVVYLTYAAFQFVLRIS